MRWVIYLLEVSASLTLFYAFYHVFLRRLTFFSSNRRYLLFTILLSCIIPLLHFEIERAYPEQKFVPPHADQLPPLGEISFDQPDVNHGRLLHSSQKKVIKINWLQLVGLGYFIIALIIFVIYLRRLFQLWLAVAIVDERRDGLKVIFKEEGFTNCSFFNYVFINKNQLTPSALEILLTHEYVHARLYHSLDKLLLQLCKTLLWFNPVVYLYDRALDQVHEYEADKEASHLFGRNTYASTLLSLTTVNFKNNLAHSFAEKPLTERIKMLFKSPSSTMKKSMYLGSVPLALAMLGLFAVEFVYAQPSIQRVKIKAGYQAAVREFIEVKNRKSADGSTGVQIYVNSPNGIPLFGMGGGDLTLKVVVNGRVYSMDEARQFSPSFLKRLSRHQGDGFGRIYNVKGINETDYVVWFGEEPRLTSLETKNRMASRKYKGKTVYGKLAAYSYLSDKKTGNGLVVKLNTGDTIMAYVAPEFASHVNKEFAVGDDIKIKAFNAYCLKGIAYPVIGSGTYVKSGKVIFDRNRFVIDDRKEDVKTNYRTLPVIAYTASDSTKFSKDRKIVDLYGKVEVTADSIVIRAEHINFDSNTNLLTALKAVVSSPYSDLNFRRDLLIYNVKTKRYITK